MKTTDVVLTKQPNPTQFDSVLTECQAIAGFKIDNFLYSLCGMNYNSKLIDLFTEIDLNKKLKPREADV